MIFQNFREHFHPSNPENDIIARAEFYDNGSLNGTDWEAPFGNLIRNLKGETYDLLRSSQQIMAKAYDSRGAIGTASSLDAQITAGNARPALTIPSPQDGTIIQQDQIFHVSYMVSDPDGPGDLAGVKGYGFYYGRSDSVIIDYQTSDSAAPFNPSPSTSPAEPARTLSKSSQGCKRC
jgi:hypothetical protein